MTSYPDFVTSADEHFRNGRFKEAHIDYGRALSGGYRENYCRQMRGMSSRRVAQQRLQKAEDRPEERQAFLRQSARWLAKAEANLESALEEAVDDAQRGRIRIEQAETEEAMARFMTMSGGDPSRRLAEAKSYRAEGERLLGDPSSETAPTPSR